MEKQSLPISQKSMTRILVVFCLVLSLLGGYFHAQRKTLERRYTTLQVRYTNLETKYNTLLDDYAAELDKPKVPDNQ